MRLKSQKASMVPTNIEAWTTSFQFWFGTDAGFENQAKPQTLIGVAPEAAFAPLNDMYLCKLVQKFPPVLGLSMGRQPRAKAFMAARENQYG
jgi:hypothetical protein